jgi:hypothetical protein
MDHEVKQRLIAPGRDTSEAVTARSGARWGVIATVLGIVLAAGPTLVQSIGVEMGNDAFVTVGGALIAVAGIVQKTLADLGYIKSRTEVKTQLSWHARSDGEDKA